MHNLPSHWRSSSGNPSIWDLTIDNTRLTFLTKCNYQITKYAYYLTKTFFYRMMTSIHAWPSTILLGDIWCIWLVFWHYIISIFRNQSSAEIECTYAGCTRYQCPQGWDNTCCQILCESVVIHEGGLGHDIDKCIRYVVKISKGSASTLKPCRPLIKY